MASLVLLSALAGAACGYALVGRGGGSIIPEHVKTIAVVPFENRTNRPEVEQRVTEEVAREFTQRGRYKVLADPGKAQAVLEGVIVNFQTHPVQFSNQGRATRVETVVTLQATLRETATDQVLWSQAQLLFREQYDVPEQEGEFFDQETLALDDLARGAAGTLVTSILEGF
jgi:TolB-like protein